MSEEELIAALRRCVESSDGWQLEMVKLCGTVDDDATTTAARAELDAAIVDAIRHARVSLAGLDKAMDMLAHTMLNRRTRILTTLGGIRDGLN